MNQKLPPQALAEEGAILGAILLERDAMARVVEIIKPMMFYKTKNGTIFQTMREMFEQGNPIDVLTLRKALASKNELERIGGETYLVDLTIGVANAANIEYHARVVSEKWMLRELCSTSNRILSQAYHETTDVFELIETTENRLFEITAGNVQQSAVPVGNLVLPVMEKIEKVRQSGTIPGIPSGIADLDKLTGGWQKTDLVILAARPAMGKTAFALRLSRNAAMRFQEPVAFFSLEMAKNQLTQRLVVSEAEIDAQKVRNGTLEDYEYKALLTASGKFSNAPIYIDDEPAIGLAQLRAKARRLKSQKNIGIVVVDYLQLMTGAAKNKGNREQEIASISRGLKEIAKSLDVVVIALSQLSRAVESRGGDKRPQLSDLRESGSIEQDADMVMFLYRPEYYGFETDDEGNSTLGLAELIISKQRNGPTGTVKMQFIGKYGKFSDWGPTQQQAAKPMFAPCYAPPLDEVDF